MIAVIGTDYPFTLVHMGQYVRPPAIGNRKQRLRYVVIITERDVTLASNDGSRGIYRRAELIGWTIEDAPTFRPGDVVTTPCRSVRFVRYRTGDVFPPGTLLVERPRPHVPPTPPPAFAAGEYVRYRPGKGQGWIGCVQHRTGAGERVNVKVIEAIGNWMCVTGDVCSVRPSWLRRTRYRPRPGHVPHPYAVGDLVDFGGYQNPKFLVLRVHGSRVQLLSKTGNRLWLDASKIDKRVGPKPLPDVHRAEVAVLKRKLTDAENTHRALRTELEEWRTGQRIKTGHGTSVLQPRTGYSSFAARLAHEMHTSPPGGLGHSVAVDPSKWQSAKHYPVPELCSGWAATWREAATVANFGDPAPREGRKDDSGKPRYDLIPPRALADVARVLTFGAVKYGDENWRQVPHAKARYYAACMRHLEAWRLDPTAVDHEFRLPHLAHALCCIIFLSELDRPAKVS
mgnify:CR=1 FL=1